MRVKRAEKMLKDTIIERLALAQKAEAASKEGGPNVTLPVCVPIATQDTGSLANSRRMTFFNLWLTPQLSTEKTTSPTLHYAL
jgi:hypothetical protein